ncbi:unnamed protein product [Leptidea sinapis]|uniref:TIL domain-containing protein n=1 Tax=Leptidea sinapis TaxID=189913 RepID=A0A5E4PTH4_9NEOP|nr:unnamed protein product [Leptidea sinapis]
MFFQLLLVYILILPGPQCDATCGGDNNATAGCGNHCGNSCSDYNALVKLCVTKCDYNSCDCKPGYVYNNGLGYCIYPDDC